MMLKKLLAKRHDYALLDLMTTPALEKEMKITVKMLHPIVAIMPLYLLFNKNEADLARRYDTVIEEMIQDGTLDEVYKQYSPYSYNDIMKMQAAQ